MNNTQGQEEQISVASLVDLKPGDVVVSVMGTTGGAMARVSRKFGAPVLAPTRSPDWGTPMPWNLRLAYAWRALGGRVRVAKDSIDASRLESDGFLQGTIRVQMRPGSTGWMGE